MWPKFSENKSVKSVEIKLDLEPLNSPIKAETSNSLEVQNHRLWFYTSLKFLYIGFIVYLSGVIIYHAIHCGQEDASSAKFTADFMKRWNKFYMIYVFPKIGDEQTNVGFIPNGFDDQTVRKFYMEKYEGEPVLPDDGSLLDSYRARFQIYQTRFNKKYIPVEVEYRFRVYVSNILQYLEEENKDPSIDYDDTPFTDRTDAELRSMLMTEGDQPLFEGSSRYEEKSNVARPLSVDWRTKEKVTAIRNQDQCGSCWAFAVCAAIESQQAIKNNELVLLSEQQLVDCDSKDHGCHGGYRPYAMEFVMQNGLYKESSYPYLGQEGHECKVLNESKVYINDYKILSKNEDIQANWVAEKGPVTFGMKVIKQMFNYRNGIFSPSRSDCEEHSLGSHAMTIIGYGSESGQDYWLVKNSWGTNWGQSGFFKLARGNNACGAAENVVAAIIN